MTDVTIRDRRSADLDRCVEALAAVHLADRYPLNWPADPREWLSPPGTLHAWVAEVVGSGVVGHLAVQAPTNPGHDRDPSARPTAEVSRLFVVPAARRQSLASRLLRQAEEWATVQGYDLVLEVVDEENSSAVAVYERAGWRHTGTSTADWTAPDGGPVTLRHYRHP